MNTDFDTLGLSPGPSGYSPLQQPPLYPPGGSAALTPPQQAMLRLLLGHITANSSPYAPFPASGMGSSAPPAASTPAPTPAAMPRYQVTRHPNAPKSRPFAILDNATGGYVPGGAPMFPRLFSTQAEAQAAMPSDETVPGDLGAQSLFSYGLENGQTDDLLQEPFGFAPASLPRYQVMPNPDAPAKLRYGHWDNQSQDWVRSKYGFAHGFSTRAEAEANTPTEEPTAGQAAGVQKPLQFVQDYDEVWNPAQAKIVPGDEWVDWSHAKGGETAATPEKLTLQPASAHGYDPTNGWGKTFWRAVRDHKVYSDQLAKWKEQHPGQPGDPTLAGRAHAYQLQIDQMRKVSPTGELRANYAADGGNPNLKPQDLSAKATPQQGGVGNYLSQEFGLNRYLPGAALDTLYQYELNPFTGKPFLPVPFVGQNIIAHAVASPIKSVTDIPKNIETLTAQVKTARIAMLKAQAALKAHPNDHRLRRAAQIAEQGYNQTRLYAAKQALVPAAETGTLPLYALGVGGSPALAARGSAIAMGSGILAGPAAQGTGSAAGAKPGHRIAAFGRGFDANIATQEKANPFAIPSQIATVGLPILGTLSPLPPSLDTTPLLPPDLMPPGEEGTYVPLGTDKTAVARPKSWNEVAHVHGKKVYQRSDLIDPNRLDSKGRTNVVRMQKGLAPIGPDGEPINLHHLTQEDDSPIAEMTKTFHQENSGILHIDRSTTRSRINRPRFGRWKKRKYWPTRANDFTPQESRK